jgi:hypothetical protein
MSFYKLVSSYIPNNSAPIAYEALRMLEQFDDNLSAWEPSSIDEFNSLYIASWGISFAIFKENTTLNYLRKKFANQIVKTGEPDSKDMAEISAMTLALGAGAQDIKHIKRSVRGRTPDFRAVWQGKSVDVEVTRADRKPEHKNIQKNLISLSRQLQNYLSDFDLTVNLPRPLNSKNLKHMLDAVDKLQIGDELSDIPLWHLQAKPIMRDVGTLITGNRWDPLPDWWDHDLVRTIYFSQIVDTRDAERPHPQIKIFHGLPLTGYINPVQRKADRPQGSKGVPYLIACDTSKLPEAFQEFRRVLPDYFEMWNHVSGFLLFSRYLLPSPWRLFWKALMIPNDLALLPLPDEPISRFQSEGRSMEFWINLTNST